MKFKLILLAALALLLGHSLLGQDDTPAEQVAIIRSYDAFIDSTLITDTLGMEVHSKHGDFLRVARFVKDKGDRYNDLFDIYGIEYGGETYFHMHYLKGIGREKYFVKLQVKGAYGLFSVLEGSGADASSFGTKSKAFYPALVGRMMSRWQTDAGGWGYLYLVDIKNGKRARALDKTGLVNRCAAYDDLKERAWSETNTLEEAIDVVRELNSRLTNVVRAVD